MSDVPVTIGKEQGENAPKAPSEEATTEEVSSKEISTETNLEEPEELPVEPLPKEKSSEISIKEISEENLSEEIAAEKSSEAAVSEQSLEERLSPWFVVFLCLATLSMFMGLVPLTQTIIPRHVDLILGSPQDKSIVYSNTSLLQSFLGLGALIIYPVVGALSDRTRTRFGRRRPWIVGGVLGGAVMLILLANSVSYWMLAAAWIGFCLFATTTQSSLTTLLPDKIPTRQRAKVAAFTGLMAPVGIIVGSILAGRLGQSNHTTIYYVLAVVQLLAVLFFATQLHEKLPSKESIPPFKLGQFLGGFWVNPRTHPDFALAWVARLMIIFGCVVLQDYLRFFLQDSGLFSEAEAGNGVAIFTTFSTVGILLGSFGTGFLSDRLLIRKPFGVAAGLLVALALVCTAFVAFFPSLTAIYATAFLFGIGFGTYSATEVALGTQVLRSKESHGKDMGVLAMATNLSQAIGPFFAASIVIATGNYGLLFLLAAIPPVISALCIPFIKGVK